MLTARGRPEDVLQGFASGADDYLAKPFDLSVLLARLQGLLRRSEWMLGKALDVRNRARPKAPASATSEHFPSPAKPSTSVCSICGPKETRFTSHSWSRNYSAIGANDGHIVSRKQILEEVWGCTKTPTRARSTISWFACGVRLRMILAIRGICSRCGEWGTGLSRTRKAGLRAARRE